MFFMVAYVGSQVVGGGTAFSSSLGISTSSGMWLTAAIILLYTMLSGFHAVSKTDVLQALFMFFSLIILPIVAIIQLGGIGPILDAMHAEGAGFNPHILVRYMSLKNVKEMRQAAMIGTVWNVIMGWGAVWVGLAGRAFFSGPEAMPNENHEAIFLQLGQEVFNPLFMGILMVAVLAAIMSSADSQLLVGASAIVRDVYDKLFGKGKEISEEKTRIVQPFCRIILNDFICMASILS